MAKPLFTEIFGECLETEIKALVEKSLIDDCKLDLENRKLSLKIYSEKYINKETANNIINAFIFGT